MILDKIEINKCNGCTACSSICPNNCIEMKANEDGFLYPIVNKDNCISCNLCDKVCPVNNEIKINDVPNAYAAINKKEEERLQSSSGGIFSLIANYILDKNGYVVGAAYNDKFEVEHIIIDSKEELHKLRGAKYSQSRLGNVFGKIKELLDTDHYVLFSGTPCQTGGLKYYLRKDYEKLVLIDTVCHGVPSPLVWKKYVEYRSKTDNKGEIPISINLRSKSSGWSRYNYSIEFDYGKKLYSKVNGQDPYMKAFVGNYCLRESCYDCSFISTQRVSDFTLGDYWGIWNQNPEMDDNKGTSLLLVHSIKGNKILETISNQLNYIQVDLNESIKENPSIIKSSPINKDRSVFIDTISKEGFKQAIKKYELLTKMSKKDKMNIFLTNCKNKLLFKK